MGMRFRKSVKIAPGIKMNLGTKSVGMSFGTKGCRYSINSSGRRTSTVGIPGTGLSYSTSHSSSKRSYNSSNYVKRSEIQRLKQQQKLEELEANRLSVEEYTNYIDLIKNVHRECDTPIDWVGLSVSDEPFAEGCIGPKESAAIEELENFKPTFIERLFKKKAEAKKQNLESNIHKAHDEDLVDYSAWQHSVNFAIQILSGNIDAYYEAITESNPFEDLVEFGSGFEFGTDDPESMEIEFTVKSKDVIPEKMKSLTKTGKLSEKPLTKTAYFDITQDYVCSCAIRLAREIFALLPVKSIIVNATDNILNTATGLEENQTILSVQFEKEKFENINFDKIDASDFTEIFNHNMTLKKTSGFRPVERIY